MLLAVLVPKTQFRMNKAPLKWTAFAMLVTSNQHQIRSSALRAMPGNTRMHLDLIVAQFVARIPTHSKLAWTLLLVCATMAMDEITMSVHDVWLAHTVK